jgi:hypothetical protein
MVAQAIIFKETAMRTAHMGCAADAVTKWNVPDFDEEKRSKALNSFRLAGSGARCGP